MVKKFDELKIYFQLLSLKIDFRFALRCSRVL